MRTEVTCAQVSQFQWKIYQNYITIYLSYINFTHWKLTSGLFVKISRWVTVSNFDAAIHTKEISEVSWRLQSQRCPQMLTSPRNVDCLILSYIIYNCQNNILKSSFNNIFLKQCFCFQNFMNKLDLCIWIPISEKIEHVI